METGEPNSPFGEKIQIRGLDRSAIATQIFRSQIIGKEKNNVGSRVYAIESNRRNDYDAIVEDTSQIKNIILKYMYDIKRPNQDWKYDFPNLLFFHEKGLAKRQYHTHLLMPECKYDSIQMLEFIWNNKLKKKRKCFSKYNIHIREIDNPSIALEYVNKETSLKHNSLDYENSHFILPNI